MTVASAPTETSLGGLAEACDVDQEVDAFLPLRATLRNEGTFATDTTMVLRVHDLLYGQPGDPIAINAGTTFKSEGPSCPLLAGTSEGSVSLHHPSIAPDATAQHDYLLVLHNYFSPNFDSDGNRFRLRHLIGYIGLKAQVAGDEAGNAIYLTNVDCYRGTADQGVDGPGAPSTNSSVLPGFALSDSGLNYAYRRDNIYYEPNNDRLSPATDSGTGC